MALTYQVCTRGIQGRPLLGRYSLVGGHLALVWGVRAREIPRLPVQQDIARDRHQDRSIHTIIHDQLRIIHNPRHLQQWQVDRKSLEERDWKLFASNHRKDLVWMCCGFNRQ